MREKHVAFGSCGGGIGLSLAVEVFTANPLAADTATHAEVLVAAVIVVLVETREAPPQIACSSAPNFANISM